MRVWVDECVDFCGTCIGPSNLECSICVTNSVLLADGTCYCILGFFLVPNKDICSATCPVGYGPNSATRKCEIPCSSTSCTNCEETFKCASGACGANVNYEGTC